MKINEIYKIYGENYREMTRQLLEKSALIDEIPEGQPLIGIKPNLVSPTEASYGGTTHPEVVAGIIEYLKEHGKRNLIILEGSWVGDKTEEAVRVCGYDKLSADYGIPFFDLQKDSASARWCGGMELMVCDKVKAVDFLINVPVLKGHCQTKITCALKNLKGLLPNREKRHFHAMGLHKPIAHLSAGVHQDFIVVDHICGDLDFEDGGHPVVRNCVMTAKDPVLMDAYVCQLLHYRTEDVPYIGMAQELGVGSADLRTLELSCFGEEGQEELPRSDKVVSLQDAVWEVESCSACYGYLLPALDRLREDGLWEDLRDLLGENHLAIGQGYQGKTGAFGIGRCTGAFDFYVPGCPPTENEIYEALRDLLMKKKTSKT